MKKVLMVAALTMGALAFSGCEDRAAIEREEKREKAKLEAYNNDFQTCNQTFNDARAKESSGQLQQAQGLFEAAASQAEVHATEPGTMKVKFVGIQQQARAAAERLKTQIATNEKIAIAEAEKKKKDEELKKKADAEKTKIAAATAPTTSLATGTTPVGDAAPVTPTAPATPAAGGGDDDDPIAKAGTGAAPAAGGVQAKAGDIFTPLDEKAPFKCYKVVVQKKYAFAYVIVRNTSDKPKRVVRFISDFATAKSESTWPVSVFYMIGDFKDSGKNDLDGDNPNPVKIEQLGLAPGEDARVVLLSNMAERDFEFKGAVKLTGSVMWSDGTESNVINNLP